MAKNALKRSLLEVGDEESMRQGRSRGCSESHGGSSYLRPIWDDTGGGAAGASSIFIPDEKLMYVLEGHEELASKLGKLNEKTSSPSLECNMCALVRSSEKEGTEFASLHDMKELHAMGQVAVLSAIEITYFAVNPFKP